MAETGTVQQVSDADFEKSVLQSTRPVFVDFWAPWCGPCRIIGPIVEELAPNYEGKMLVTKLNTDENPETAQKYGVMSIPTLLIFKDGSVVDRAMGAMPKSELQRFIERNLA
jgi:thioredoxin 1